MAQPAPDSPRSISKTYSISKDRNVHCLTPKQQVIHQQTIIRHLSNRKLPQVSSPICCHKQNVIEFDEKSNGSRSHSVLKDLPIFSRSSIRKNRSAPSLSLLQQHKLETGLYLHPSQIPRSLSANFSDYKPNQAISLLMSLPTEAYLGIGSGFNMKSLLQAALKQVDDELGELAEEEDLRIDSSINASQAIPTAPDTIPPTSIIAPDLSTKKEKEIEIDVDQLPAPPSPNIDNRAFAECVKHDIEQALKQGYTRNLCIAVLQALIGAFLYGWNVAILNVPQNVIQHNETLMSDTQYALLNNMFCAGGLFGALCAGPLQDKIGRKKALLFIDIIFIISAILTYLYANGTLINIHQIAGYILFWCGRFIVGVACGAATAVVPTYLGEISPPLIRGAIGTSNQLTICFGVVITELVGYKSILGGNNTWQYLFLGNALPIIQLLTFWTFPESPKWLVQKGRDCEAREALQILRETNDVRVDMMLMKGGLLHEKNAFHSPHVSPKQRRKHNEHNEPLLSLQRQHNEQQNEPWKAVKWATIISIVLMLMQQFSGINAVFYYSATILNNAGITSDASVWLGSLAISVANFFAVFIAVFAIDRAGRKILLILSCIVMIIASILVSIAIMLESHGVFWQYSSIGCLILFVIGFEIGLGAIPWLMMAELAPMQYRGVIVAIATASNWASNLLIAQFSGPIIKIFYFYPFALVCFVGIIFTLKFIPETNGKTAAEIQKELINI